jgi:AcrR family transcriptional regulator
MAKHGPETRRQILRAALRRFANGGYAATSVQQIVGDAKVSKPALYYHFRDKADLFQALVSEAHDERLQVVQQAAARKPDVRGQLIEILAALFDYFHQNRELTRIAFATAFAAPGEVPPDLRYLDQCQRNLKFMRRSSNARRRTGNWATGLTAGIWRMVFTGRHTFTSRRIC